MEKYLLQTYSPDAYACTKALCVSYSYLLLRQPIDLTILQHPSSWLLIVVSMLNTPIYARLARDENLALTIPIVAATSNLLRMLWYYFFFDKDLETRHLCGFIFIVIGMYLTK